MRQICLLIGLILWGTLSNAFAQGNEGYIQRTEQVQPSTAQNAPTQGTTSTMVQSAENNQPAVNVKQADFSKTPLNKLGRGVANMATCWLEIPATAEREAKAKHSEMYGGTAGILGGVFMALARAFTGFVDTATFLFPPYDKPMMKPTYAYDSFVEADENTTITQ